MPRSSARPTRTAIAPLGLALALGATLVGCGDDSIAVGEGPDPVPGDAGYPLPEDTVDSFISCQCLGCADAPPDVEAVVPGCTVHACDADVGTLTAACEAICRSHGFDNCEDTPPYDGLGAGGWDCAEEQCLACDGSTDCPSGQCFPWGGFCSQTCTGFGQECSECLDCLQTPEGDLACFPPTPLGECAEAMGMDAMAMEAMAMADASQAKMAYRLANRFSATVTNSSSFVLDASGLEDPSGGTPTGELRFVARDCPGAGCRMQLTDLRFRVGHLNLDLEDPAGSQDVDDLEVFLRVRAPVSSGVIPAGAAEFAIRYVADGHHQDSTFQNSEDCTFDVDFDAGLATFGCALDVGAGSVDLDLVASVTNEPPQAAAGPEVVECTSPAGTPVGLDATASSDFGPGLGISSYEWFTDFVAGPDTGTLVATGATPGLVLGLGPHAFTVRVADGTGSYDTDDVAVAVVDTTPPEIGAPDATIGVCLPQATEVEIPVVTATDACSDPDDVELVVVVSRVKGTPVAPDAFPIVDGTVLLPLGAHELTWTATDAQGLVTVETSVLEVVHDVNPECCEDEQILIEGSPADDDLVHNADAGYCIFGYAGDDTLHTKKRDDFLVGGEGVDTVFGGGDDDVVQGSEGEDTLILFRGADLSFGGPDDDVINGSHDSDVLYGNTGNDTLNAHQGDDTIYPGPGMDVVHGHQGDDTVILYDACEVVAGEILNGGPGQDTLVTPVPLPQLEALGAFVLSFEHIVVDAGNTLFSECQ